jgi:hypothetical protein
VLADGTYSARIDMGVYSVQSKDLMKVTFSHGFEGGSMTCDSPSESFVLKYVPRTAVSKPTPKPELPKTV